MTVRAYCRVSTEEQNLGMQEEACMAYCQQQGHTEVLVYTDQGYSRDTDPASRPGFAQLLNDIESGDLIVVYQRDRLGEGIALAVLERELEQLGCHVESTKGAGNGRTVEDQLIRRILDAVSEYEHSIIRRRVKDKLAAKKRAGEVYTGRLYGHEKLEGRFVPNPNEQQTISLMRSLHEQGYSLRQIASELTLRECSPPRGRRAGWSPQTIANILSRSEAGVS